MLSLAIRIALILTATIFILMVIHNVNRRRLLLKYSLSWLLIAPAMILVALFPEIASFLAKLLQVEAPSNLIYMVGFFLLLFFSLLITVRLSKQSSDLREVIQQQAIDRFIMEQHLK